MTKKEDAGIVLFIIMVIAAVLGWKNIFKLLGSLFLSICLLMADAFSILAGKKFRIKEKEAS